MLKEIFIISDFSAQALGNQFQREMEDIHVIYSPFNQVYQTLFDESTSWNNEHQLTICWTQAEKISNEFSKCVQFEEFDHLSLVQETEQFCELLKSTALKTKFLFVPLWTLDSKLSYSGKNKFKDSRSPYLMLHEMNNLLIQRLKEISNLVLFDTANWMMNINQNAYHPKLWYLSKTLFHSDLLKEAFIEMKSVINEINGKSKKLIIVDLDQTLWGGVLGDDGAENIVLGGHHPLGEVFKDFQLALKSLKNRGIILAISSKNDENYALDCIENHPEMVLRKKDFVAWKINWNDKYENIVDIVTGLNIGFESVVFLDDNPNERERIKSTLPAVFVPDLPRDPLLYRQFLLGLNCFHTSEFTQEDQRKTVLYHEENIRNESIKQFENIEDWLKTIEIKVSYEYLNEGNFNRVLQLFNKTNQMNLQTRRLNENELKNNLNNKEHQIIAFYVKDKFGDAGLTAVLGLKKTESALMITDFILSCRIINRNVEETLLAFAVNVAKKDNLATVTATYIETERNQPCLLFFKRSGFRNVNQQFMWDTNVEYPFISYIEIDEIK